MIHNRIRKCPRFHIVFYNLIKSKTNKVEITGDDIEDVEVINKDGKLKIRMKFDKICDLTKCR